MFGASQMQWQRIPCAFRIKKGYRHRFVMVDSGSRFEIRAIPPNHVEVRRFCVLNEAGNFGDFSSSAFLDWCEDTINLIRKENE